MVQITNSSISVKPVRDRTGGMDSGSFKVTVPEWDGWESSHRITMQTPLASRRHMNATVETDRPAM